MEIANDADVGRLLGIEYGLKNNEQEGKPKMSLLPLDLLTELLVPAYSEGLLKYERESWRKGFKVSTMMDSTLRHLSAFYYDREDYDHETEEKYNIQKHHLGACIFGLISMYNSVHNHVGLDDRPESISKEEREYRRKLGNFDGMDKIMNAVTGEVNEDK